MSQKYNKFLISESIITSILKFKKILFAN